MVTTTGAAINYLFLYRVLSSLRIPYMGKWGLAVKIKYLNDTVLRRTADLWNAFSTSVFLNSKKCATEQEEDPR